MKIYVLTNDKGIKYFVSDEGQYTQIGALAFTGTISREKAGFIMSIFDNGMEYDMEKFFRVWIRIKALHMVPMLQDDMKALLIEKFRNMLINGSGA